LSQAAAGAEQAAFVAAASFASGTAAVELVDEWRRAAADCRERRPPSASHSAPMAAPPVRTVLPWPQRLRAAARLATTGPAWFAGIRLAVCMTIATGVTCALHSESHSFWLPLTVAVAVRPEYASVFVRTINRVAGTAAGALLAAAAIAVLGSGWPVAIAAAVSLGFAVLATPRLYGLGVVGITCSALLSSCIGAADPVSPAVRLLDTLIGAAIAIVFGYLIWPGRSSPPVRLLEAVDAVIAYLHEAEKAPDERRDWDAVRDRAYQLAHQSRQSAQAALLDPLPARTAAADILPRALALEELVDDVTALANGVSSDTAELADRIRATAQPTTSMCDQGISC
jgi:uncharacterized membrane protein YccC